MCQLGYNYKYKCTSAFVSSAARQRRLYHKCYENTYIIQKRIKIISIDIYYFRERLSATVGLRAYPEQDDSRLGQCINLHVDKGGLPRGLLKRASFYLSFRGV